MFHSETAELKQQGAIAAARDPHSKVTVKDAERVLVEQTKAAGGAAFNFNPNASPEEKAAEARAVSPNSWFGRGYTNFFKHIPADFYHERRSHAAGLVSDQV